MYVPLKVNHQHDNRPRQNLEFIDTKTRKKETKWSERLKLSKPTQ